jgi:hypothetical protein
MLFLDSALARRNTVVGCTWLFLEKILQLHFRGGQAPIPVRLCARQTGTKLTLLARLCATGGATNRHRFFRLDFHDYIMRADLISVWSIVTTGPQPDATFLFRAARKRWAMFQLTHTLVFRSEQL